MSDQRAPGQRISVLVIEDNIDTSASMARFLRLAAGFDVRVAYDGAMGLKKAVADLPDAIVCDIGLPKVDRFQLAKELVATLRRKPLMIALIG